MPLVQVIKFVEQNAEKARALANELNLQAMSTTMYHVDSGVHVADPSSLAPNLDTYINGHKWGFRNAEDRKDIDYSVGESNALERQYLRFMELGSGQQASSTLR